MLIVSISLWSLTSKFWFSFSSKSPLFSVCYKLCFFVNTSLAAENPASTNQMMRKPSKNGMTFSKSKEWEDFTFSHPINPSLSILPPQFSQPILKIYQTILDSLY